MSPVVDTALLAAVEVNRGVLLAAKMLRTDRALVVSRPGWAPEPGLDVRLWRSDGGSPWWPAKAGVFLPIAVVPWLARVLLVVPTEDDQRGVGEPPRGSR